MRFENRLASVSNCLISIVFQLLLSHQLVLGSPFQATNESIEQFHQFPLTKDGYYNIGKLHRKVTTKSTKAQIWFDRGLAMCYGFNHEEAVRCFRKAIVADPSMAMAYWGLAYAMGPNINNMEIPNDQIAQANFALQLAKMHQASCTEVERQLISALEKRYQIPVPDIEDRTPLNQDYSEALRSVHEAFPEDSTVAALFAESLLNLSPWNQWTKAGQPTQFTPEAIRVLESGLQKWPDHPAICHLYIHAMEASPEPEKALPAANRLRNAMPGCGHMVHMPSHIDVLVGDYQRVVQTNQRAIVADNLFLEKEGPFNFYTLYRIHNYHFVVYGAMFEGQSKLAMQAARNLVAQVPEQMLAEQTDFLDAFMQIPMHVMIRFGQWDSILKEPKPSVDLPMSLSTWHYARTVAYAATNQVAKAEQELDAFKSSKAKVPETSVLFNNTSLNILEVAHQMAAGEVEYRKGNYQTAFQHLRNAVKLDDDLNYDEPWGWMQPARHALGALLLEQKRFADAEKVYRADLERRPKNAWSLHGLTTCLEKQNRPQEAQKSRVAFEWRAREPIFASIALVSVNLTRSNSKSRHTSSQSIRMANPIYVDAEFAYRLESAEGKSNAELVETRFDLLPSSQACWEQIAGAYLMFDGVGSEITQSFGLGMQSVLGDDEWTRIESFYQDRGSAVNHEVCPLADPDVLVKLHQRNYRPIEWSTVLYRQLDQELKTDEHDFLIRQASPDERSQWIATAVEGWSEFPEFRDVIGEFCLLTFQRKTSHCFIALLDSLPIATGSLIIQDKTALLAGASTIPGARKRGAQNALLAARLNFARQQGCDLAMVVAAPGSTSQRNAQRNGFQIAYTRTKWQK